MNRLSKIIFLFVISPSVFAKSFLTLYFFSSPSTYNWSTPKSLTRSVVKNSLVYTKYKMRHMLSHVSVKLKCNQSTKIERNYLTGMTTSDYDYERDLLLKEKIGLGLMFSPIPGRLQTKNEVKSAINERIGNKELRWLKYQIKDSTCERLSTYLDKYIDLEIGNIYGLPFDPRKKEGAGCSAFAISFLDLAGIMSDEFKLNWSRRLFVPKILNAYSGTISEISLWKLLFSPVARNWGSKANDNSTEIFFWDPNLMFDWVKRTWDLEKSRNINIFKLEQNGKSLGLFRDVRHIETPPEPIFIK
jgi:hypothetical protein